MKKFYKSLAIVFFFAISITPLVSQAATYELSDGDYFEGTEEEYKYAELLLKIESDLPIIIERAWQKTSGKTKFPSVDTVLKKTKVSGSATYNSKTKEFTISNQNDGVIVLDVKHGLSKTKVFKIIDTFTENLILEIDAYQKNANVKIPTKIKEDSDLDYINSSFEDTFYDLGFELGTALKSIVVEIDGKTNKISDQSMLVYGMPTKNYTLKTENIEDYYRKFPSTFNDEPLIFEFDTIPQKNVYVNMKLDEKADPNTTINFKVSDVRGFSKLKASDIWLDLYE